MTAPVRAIFEKVWLRLLDRVDLEEGEQVSIPILKREKAGGKSGGALSARDFLKLPVAERTRLMAEAAALAEQDYRTIPT